MRGPYFNHRGNACWRLIRGRLTAGRSEQDEEWDLEKQLSEESSTLFQVLCVQSNISCVFFLTSSWPEGCLIALISEEKGNSHCQERDIKLSEGTTVSQPLCPASSNHLTTTPSPLHSSFHNAASNALLMVALQDVKQMVSRL